MYGRVVFTLVGVLKCMGELFLHLWVFLLCGIFYIVTVIGHSSVNDEYKGVVAP